MHKFSAPTNTATSRTRPLMAGPTWAFGYAGNSRRVVPLLTDLAKGVVL